MSRRLILFAPGAGAPSSHPWMQDWKRRLSEIGEVETFDYDYMRAGRKRPDPLPQLIAAHRAALEEAREKHQPDSTFLIGKSMGGRIGSIHFEPPLGGRADKSEFAFYHRATMVLDLIDVATLKRGIGGLSYFCFSSSQGGICAVRPEVVAHEHGDCRR